MELARAGERPASTSFFHLGIFPLRWIRMPLPKRHAQALLAGNLEACGGGKPVGTVLATGRMFEYQVVA